MHHNYPDGHIDLRTGTRDGLAYRSISHIGPDVPLQDVDQLLQPFRRLTDQVGDGLGLVPSIVQAIADAHHATITAEPRPDSGLSMEISFPNPARTIGHRTTTAPERETQPAPAPEATVSCDLLMHR